MQDVYETSDLGLATTLSCLGYKITTLDRSNPRRVVFCFAWKDGIEDDVQRFWEGSIKLSPTALFTHQKMLKQRIYGDKATPMYQPRQ